MLFKRSTLCATLLVSALAQAQTRQMADPDILGVKPGMPKAEALALIKEKFPNSKITPTVREVMLGNADLMYEAQIQINLDKRKLSPNTSEDVLTLTFLPDDAVLGIRRVMLHRPGKQQTADLLTALQQKFGMPVHFVYDDTTRFEDQSMWSDRMLPGLSLVGTRYVQGGRISSSDFGTVTPYPYCWMEMLVYTGELFDPIGAYRSLTDRSGVAANKAKEWQSCGKALWVANMHERPLYYNATRTEMILVDLSKAPVSLKSMPDMLKANPRTTYAKPVTEMPKPSADTPAL